MFNVLVSGLEFFILNLHNFLHKFADNLNDKPTLNSIFSGLNWIAL